MMLILPIEKYRKLYCNETLIFTNKILQKSSYQIIIMITIKKVGTSMTYRLNLHIV